LFSTQKDDQIFFNAQEFLITCCIDDLPVMSLEKAFFVLQQNDTCSISEVHSIFQQFMCIVPPTHRTDPTSRESVNPYPFNKLEKAWIGLEERANWEQVSHAINAECPDWLACPLYQLEVI
jgi:hypothetical protein